MAGKKKKAANAEHPRLRKLTPICLAERFFLPAYIVPRGWFGLRLDRGPVDWSEVANVVELSYRLVAPKTLLKALDGA
jgi:hypothetical protein